MIAKVCSIGCFIKKNKKNRPAQGERCRQALLAGPLQRDAPAVRQRRIDTAAAADIFILQTIITQIGQIGAASGTAALRAAQA